MALQKDSPRRGRGDRDRHFPIAQNHCRSLLLDIPLWLSWAKCGLRGVGVSCEGATTPRILDRKMQPKNLPNKLKQIRLKAGLSKTAIIRALNYKALPLSPSHISQFERGELKPPLLLVMAYAELGGTCMCVLADDELSLD